jgi:type IV fimbrial biogenesis protein FimT
MRGFTLVEVMVTMAVAIILLMVAVPSFTHTIHNNRVGSASNALLASLTYARAEAVARGTVVSICPSTDGLSCTANGKAYDPGWLVYTYTPGNAVSGKTYDRTSGNNVLLRHISVQPGVSIRAGQGGVFSYGTQGELLTDTGVAADGTQRKFATCYESGTSVVGESSAAVHGVILTLQSSGSVSSSVLAAGSACSL